MQIALAPQIPTYKRRAIAARHQFPSRQSGLGVELVLIVSYIDILSLETISLFRRSPAAI